MAAWHKGLCVGLLLGLAPAAPAQEFNMAVKADGIRLGPHLLGPKVSPDDLKGKVVLLKFWGVN